MKIQNVPEFVQVTNQDFDPLCIRYVPCRSYRILPDQTKHLFENLVCAQFHVEAPHSISKVAPS